MGGANRAKQQNYEDYMMKTAAKEYRRTCVADTLIPTLQSEVEEMSRRLQGARTFCDSTQKELDILLQQEEALRGAMQREASARVAQQAKSRNFAEKIALDYAVPSPRS